MKNLKFLTIVCLAIVLPNFIQTEFPYKLPKEEIKELEYKQLVSAIKNTDYPTQQNLTNWLQLALENDYIDIIKYLLLNTNVDIHTKDKNGNSLLHSAVLLDDPEIVKILLQKGINPNHQNIFGDTALHQNIMYNPNLKIIKILLQAGVNPQLRNDDGETALYLYIHTTTKPNSTIITTLKKRCMCYYL